MMQNKLFELISTVKNVVKNLTIMLPNNIKVQQRITDTYGKTIDNPAELYVTLNDMCMKPIDPENDKEGMIGISLVKVCIDDTSQEQKTMLHPGNYIQLTISSTSGLDGDAVNKMHEIIRNYGGISDTYRVPELGKDMFIAHISSVPVCG
ncbi:MAG: hypothetical protein PVH36_14785 [Desulfobacterales bacterium]|jgi:hypothetical protein